MYFRVQSQLFKHHRAHQMNTDYHDFMQTMDFSGKHWSGVTTRDFPGNERDSSPWCDPISAARGKRNALWYGDRTWKWVFWGLMLWSLEKTALHLSSGRFQTHYRTQTSKWRSSIKGFIFWHLSTKRCHTDVNIHNYMLKLSGAVKILLVLCRVLLRGQDPLMADA